MIRPDRIVLTAVGLLARAALGFLGLAILFGWNAPPSPPAPSRPGDPEPAATTVTLRVPEGALARHLTVVDASGRELAILTHWMSGMTTVVSRRKGGAGVCYHLSPNGTAKLRVDGTARGTLVDAEQDGTSRVTHQVLPPDIAPGP